VWAKALLDSDTVLACGLQHGLDARGIDVTLPKRIRIFEATTPAKTQAEFSVARDGAVVIATPANMMDFEAQDTATPVTVIIKRAVIQSHVRFELPEPLR
jgi:aminomethyltransferase